MAPVRAALSSPREMPLFAIRVAIVPMVTPLRTSTVTVEPPPLLWTTWMPLFLYQALACGLAPWRMATAPALPTVRLTSRLDVEFAMLMVIPLFQEAPVVGDVIVVAVPPPTMRVAALATPV